jgi:hypothetical protein
MNIRTNTFNKKGPMKKNTFKKGILKTGFWTMCHAQKNFQKAIHSCKLISIPVSYRSKNSTFIPPH